MGRRPNPDRKPELLDGIVRYLDEHGVTNLSLRPLAAALGVSTYVLSYHFGSKEQLVAEALDSIEERQRAMLASWSQESGDLGDGFRSYWRWAADPRNRTTIRLLFDLFDLGERHPDGYGDVAKRLTAQWTSFLAAGMRSIGTTPDDAEREATLLLSTVLGLQRLLLVGVDPAAIDGAADALAERLTAASTAG